MWNTIVSFKDDWFQEAGSIVVGLYMKLTLIRRKQKEMGERKRTNEEEIEF